MLGDALRFVRFSHTVFALPFALGAMLVAAGGLPEWKLVGLIVLAMVFARTAAMVFNRLADWEIDKRNPRTVARHRLLPKPVAGVLLAVSATAFVFTTWFINPLCFWLSPVALVIVFFYSVTKRFTHLSHFFLGLALSVSPVGAWLAVRGRFELAPLVLALAVLLWVAGFDIIYATQDFEFDREEGLHSLVVRLGLPRSLRIVELLHWLMLVALAGFGWLAGLEVIYFCSVALIAGLAIGIHEVEPVAALRRSLPREVGEHRSASRLDVEGINRAFFRSNAIVSAIFLGAIACDLFFRAR